MRLRTLLRDLVSPDRTDRPRAAVPGRPTVTGLRQEWDRRRSAAETPAERQEIDAVYSRFVP